MIGLRLAKTLTLALTLAFAGGTFVRADDDNKQNSQNKQYSDDNKNHGDDNNQNGDDNKNHGDDDKGDRNDDHVSMCHHDGGKGGHTIDCDHNSVPAHLSHGDELGSCPVSGSR
jgi:hypothetical protein